MDRRNSVNICVKKGKKFVFQFLLIINAAEKVRCLYSYQYNLASDKL